MGRHTNNREHPAGSQRATVTATTSRALNRSGNTRPMPAAVPLSPPGEQAEWVNPDDWAHSHAGQVAR